MVYSEESEEVVEVEAVVAALEERGWRVGIFVGVVGCAVDVGRLFDVCLMW